MDKFKINLGFHILIRLGSGLIRTCLYKNWVSTNLKVSYLPWLIASKNTICTITRLVYLLRMLRICYRRLSFMFKICLDFFSNPLHVVIKIVLVLHIARIFGLKTAVLLWFIINCYTLTSLPEIFCPIMLIKCWGFFQYIWFIHYLNKMHCVFDKRIFFNLLIVKWTNFKGRNISENFS